MPPGWANRRASGIACRVSRSRNTRRGRAQRRATVGAKKSAATAPTATAVAVSGTAGKPPRWGVLSPMPLVFTTCTAMLMSGWRTAGMTIMRARRAMAAPGRAVVMATFASCAAAPGTFIHGICVPRTATGTDRCTATTVTVFVWPGISTLDA